MPVSLKHSFTSAKADGTDTSIVRPSDWNAEHVLTCATSRILGRTSAGAGTVEELTVGTGLTLASGSLSNSAPDQTVTLTGAGITAVSGTYPSFTITTTVTSGSVTTALGYTPASTASPTFTGTATFATADLLGSVRSNVTTVSASAIDCSAGNYFIKTASGALTWTFTNVPSSRAFSVLLELTNGGTGTQTWPAAVKWPGGTAPTLTTSGVDVLGFITDDGGTSWRGVALMLDSK